jgi:L-seryl-tRNA(Ser) seleniumtransferase
VERCRRHPLARALRPDKIALAGVFETIATWLTEGPAGLPLYALASVPAAALRERARRLAGAAETPLRAEAVASRAVFGGGTTPERSIPSAAVALAHPERSADDLARALREGPVPVIARVQSGRVLLDLRAVFEEEDETIAAALRAL